MRRGDSTKRAARPIRGKIGRRAFILLGCEVPMAPTCLASLASRVRPAGGRLALVAGRAPADRLLAVAGQPADLLPRGAAADQVGQGAAAGGGRAGRPAARAE